MTLYYYYGFKMSLDDVVIVMALHGFHLSHQTVYNWIQIFGVNVGNALRKRRYKHGGGRWHVDAAYLKIEGRWYYFYRAIDKQGHLIDAYYGQN